MFKNSDNSQEVGMKDQFLSVKNRVDHLWSMKADRTWNSNYHDNENNPSSQFIRYYTSDGQRAKVGYTQNTHEGQFNNIS